MTDTKALRRLSDDEKRFIVDALDSYEERFGTQWQSPGKPIINDSNQFVGDLFLATT